ncbi:MAG: tetratricopeptide repeat protein [Bdellovibrionota bacterium]
MLKLCINYTAKKLFVILGLIFVLAAKQDNTPLYQKNFEEIIKNYTLINDFSLKNAERNISDELFWRYPLIVPKIDFPIEFTHQSIDLEIPKTIGNGRPFEHLNKGRVAYLNKQYEEAKNIFLTARAKFGNTYKFHRRTDYFIAISFLKIAQELLIKYKSTDNNDVRIAFSNAATFLSWAFIRKKDIPDPVLEQITPKYLYNLAAIYFKYSRFAGAYGAASTGINYLRGTGQSNYRSKFGRMLAESWIKNRSYLRAVQELDTAIREDPEPQQVASAFARIGDIYFDLNNYELAEDAYALSIAVDKDRKQISPTQMILRGESLFWMGHFSQAQKMLEYGVKGSSFLNITNPLPENYSAWAKLRIADAYFARSQKNKVEPQLRDKAKISYFQVETQFPNSQAASIAKIRRACLELPYYSGNNVKHARELLNDITNTGIPTQATELAWACKTASYAQRERSQAMIERVREFSNLYPNSRFLKNLATPVKETQIAKIDQYFSNNEIHKAIIFFENNRKTLFTTISLEHKSNLFEAYIDTYQSSKAKEFWPEYKKKLKTEENIIRSIVFLSEMIDSEKSKKNNINRANQIKALINKLSKKNLQIPTDNLHLNYINRIMATSSYKINLPWTYKLATEWAKKEKKYACQLQYPLLSKIVVNSNEFSRSNFVVNSVTNAVDQHLPGILEIDFDCGSSLLELESQILADNISLYKRRWLSRLNWPMIPQVIKHLWRASEDLYDRGENESAQKIWEHISKNAPKSLPEVKYSNIRLDSKKTTFEDLW